MKQDYGKCTDCGRGLTRRERYFYEYRCDDCEEKWHWRIQAWLQGEHDAELDAMYSGPTPTRH